MTDKLARGPQAGATDLPKAARAIDRRRERDEALAMRRLFPTSFVLALAGLPAQGAASETKVIDFPCSKNLGDGRVLVNGDQWDAKMKDLGYILAENEYVPWKVLSFTQTKIQDADWADGICRMRLLAVRQ